MEQVTVEKLFKYLAYLMGKGYGNKKVIVTDDNEGNGYHGAFFLGVHKPEEVAELTEDGDLIYDSVEEDPNNCVIIG